MPCLKICRLGSHKSRTSLLHLKKCSAFTTLSWLNCMFRSDYSSPMVVGINHKGVGGARMVESINILGVGSDALNNVCLVKERQRP